MLVHFMQGRQPAVKSEWDRLDNKDVRGGILCFPNLKCYTGSVFQRFEGPPNIMITIKFVIQRRKFNKITKT